MFVESVFCCFEDIMCEKNKSVLSMGFAYNSGADFSLSNNGPYL